MMTPKRYTALRVISTLLKIMAWIVLVVSILAAAGIAFGGLFGAGQNLGSQLGDSPLTAMLTGVGGAISILLFGVIYFVALFAAGQSINLQVDVEHNTRETHELLRQILRAQQLPGEPAVGTTVPYQPLPPRE